MVFCNKDYVDLRNKGDCVTILILIDGFLQCIKIECILDRGQSHNPYFNRWFSAIELKQDLLSF